MKFRTMKYPRTKSIQRLLLTNNSKALNPFRLQTEPNGDIKLPNNIRPAKNRQLSLLKIKKDIKEEILNEREI